MSERPTPEITDRPPRDGREREKRMSSRGPMTRAPQEISGLIAIGIGIVAGAVFVGALICYGIRVVAWFVPVTEEEVVGSWISEEGGSESLVLYSDGLAVAVDLRYRGGANEVSGAGSWSLVRSGVLLTIDGGMDVTGLKFMAERSGLAVVLVDYIGDPDEGNARVFVRDDRQRTRSAAERR